MPERRTFLRRLLPLLLLAAVLPSFGAAQTIIDDEGRTITFDKPFSRIISLYPAHTENLAAMGCEAEMIGIGTADDYPQKIIDKPRFSYRDDAEKFLAATPDLLLIRPMISRSQPQLIDKLRATGITVASLQPTSIEEMLSYWRILGQLCGKPIRAEQMVEKFVETVHRLEEQLPPDERRPNVYFESIHSKMKTFDPEAIAIFALTAGGGRNVAVDATGRNDSNIAPYGKERLLSKANEIDAFLSQVGRMNRIHPQDIYQEPGFQLIKAVRNRSVCLIEEEIVSRPTMRLLTGIRQIQSCLYPDGLPMASMTDGTTSPPNSQHK